MKTSMKMELEDAVVIQVYNIGFFSVTLKVIIADSKTPIYQKLKIDDIYRIGLKFENDVE